MSVSNKVADIFASIASCELTERKSLCQPSPARLPNTILPLKKFDKRALFVPQKKVDSPSKLNMLLKAVRARMSLFLHDHAPKIASKRKRININEFDWRCAEDADYKDISRVFSGKGNWQSVLLPHYGPPIGRATAYYRTVVDIDTNMLDTSVSARSLFICFKGVDYKASVFINGAYLGSHEGFFAPFKFECTKVLKPGANVIVIKVENDAICMGNDSYGSDGSKFEGDKLYAATGPGWDEPEIGWHHCPPGMGIYQDVYIESRPNCFIKDIFVRPLIEKSKAQAWIDVFNCSAERQNVSVSMSLFGQNFKKTIFCNHQIECAPAGPGINYYRYEFEVPSPRLWDTESPWLYQIQISLKNGAGDVIDMCARHFGMRSFEMKSHNGVEGMFFLNGKPIRLRGANTMGFEQQSVMKRDFDRLRDDILLAKICNMNFWRLTQRPVQEEVYDFCDKLGLMIQTDLPLFGVLRRNQFCEAVRQAGEMEQLVRSHPCNILVSYINEPFPNAWGKPHRFLLRDELEAFFAAADSAVRLANPDRVIKPVDGDYDPPAPSLPDSHCYCGWYNGHGVDLGKLHKGYWQKVKSGWRYGCGEFGAEGLEDIGIMQKYYPNDWLPADSKDEYTWTPDKIIKAQTGKFHYMWFDTQHSVADWVRVSQKHQAWITKLMTEAFRRDNRMSSFAIHLFIDAFPAGWMKSIMDCNRTPKPAYFAYLDALEPVMASLRTDRSMFWGGEKATIEAWICNDLVETKNNLYINYSLENGGKIILAQRSKAKLISCGSLCQGVITFKLPKVKRRTRYILRLAITNIAGKVIYDTFVALEVFDKKKNAVNKPLVLMGSTRNICRNIITDMKLKSLSQSSMSSESVILVDDPKYFLKHQYRLERYVESGATLILWQWPEGKFHVFGEELKIVKCGMNPVHFVSRNTGHEIVKDFASDDFKFWFDEKAGYVTPILETTFIAPTFTPVLASGNGDWSGEWVSSLAVGLKTFGKGTLIINQLKMEGRLHSNPVAVHFVEELLNYNRWRQNVEQ